MYRGVVIVDYSFGAVSLFLEEIARNTNTAIVIYEAKEPNNIIGLSTGSNPTQKFYKNDTTTQCPPEVENDSDICEAAPLQITQLAGQFRDRVLRNAHLSLQKEEFPHDRLVSVKDHHYYNDSGNDDERTMMMGYVAQSIIYEHADENLKWRIIVASPMGRATTDTIVKGDASFVALCMLGIIGFCSCLALLVVFVRYRKERTIMLHDL